ncbi:MAG: hypothetical protein U1F35_08155 [Steroidobacteraceae bacterium]
MVIFTRHMQIVNHDLDNEGPAIGEVRPANISEPFGLLRGVDIPGGIAHCPLDFIRVERPFRFIALSMAPMYGSVKD